MSTPELFGLVRKFLTLMVLVVCLSVLWVSTGTTADSTFSECDSTARSCGASCVINEYLNPGSYPICISNCGSTFNGCVQDLSVPPPYELRDWCESKADGLYYTCNNDPASLGTNTPYGQAYSACITNGGTQSECCSAISTARREACTPEE